jgi:hypothetical protein
MGCRSHPHSIGMLHLCYSMLACGVGYDGAIERTFAQRALACAASLARNSAGIPPLGDLVDVLALLERVAALACARCKAQRFFCAATMRALPASLIPAWCRVIAILRGRCWLRMRSSSFCNRSICSFSSTARRNAADEISVVVIGRN